MQAVFYIFLESISVTVHQLQSHPLEVSGNVGDILDIGNMISDSKLFESVVGDLKPRLSWREDLKLGLLEELDARYGAKERDLCALRKQLACVKRLVTELPPYAPLRLRVLYHALDLQAANHDGDPARVGSIGSQYEMSRGVILDNDPGLAIHLDLNLAVGQADSFDFEGAEGRVLNNVRAERFRFLPLLCRGRLQSALGQYQSMQGQYAEADSSFVKSLQNLREADLRESARVGEIGQTSVYRAINALDGHFDGAMALVGGVVGDLTGAAKRLGTALELPYQHHLLLRAIYAKPDYGVVRDDYLAISHLWTEQIQHPWELIWLYRSLMLSENGAHAAAKTGFARAVEIALEPPHGDTLKLIACMISAAAILTLPDKEMHASFRELSVPLFAELAVRLPRAASYVDRFAKLIHEPSERCGATDWAILPFNYR